MQRLLSKFLRLVSFGFFNESIAIYAIKTTFGVKVFIYFVFISLLNQIDVDLFDALIQRIGSN